MNLCGVSLSDAVAQRAAAHADASGVPRGLVAGLTVVESGGQPDACGDPSSDPRAIYCASAGQAMCSWGLLQLNVCGGQGTGQSLAALTDPDTNLSLGLPRIAAAWRRSGATLATLTWDMLWAILQDSGHPGPTTDPALIALWTATPRSDLGGRTALEYVGCAMNQLDAAEAPGTVPATPPGGATTVIGATPASYQPPSSGNPVGTLGLAAAAVGAVALVYLAVGRGE